ncbi:c-type cytochrome biogenesis protein CcmI [Ferrimonas senticii]|uniref:c-type cytochrome biogenesis protein CcmI n=1 Tax=Ferrimonas senticii TaxID=394566 RepID=UPI000402447B|nr:c-type cytochrome biogenesis protein CcmI [Ferrimonas senticii]
MTNFWIAIAAITALALLVIWLPFIRRAATANKATDAEVRKQTNLNLYNERIEELGRELQEGRINQAEYQALEQELQLNLLQNVAQEDDKLSARHGSPVWPAAMSVVLLALSGYVYMDLGRANDWNLRDMPNAGSPHNNMSPEQMMAMRIEQMEQAQANDPKNSLGWFELGHAYMESSRYADSIKAFDKAIELVGAKADLLGPKATAMYYAADQNITAEVRTVIDQALADDDKDPSTRLLLGMDAFFGANYEDAIMHWELILTSPRQDIDRDGLMNAINQAKMFVESAKSAPKADNSAAVTVSLQLDGSLTADSSTAVFLFARPAGSETPVAVARTTVGKLPSTIVLDDSFAMSAANVISAHETVDVMAAIDLDGDKKPTAGDMQGQLAGVKLGSEITLTIDTVLQ